MVSRRFVVRRERNFARSGVTGDLILIASIQPFLRAPRRDGWIEFVLCHRNLPILRFESDAGRGDLTVFASGYVYTGTTLSRLFEGYVGFGEDLSSIDHDGLT